jgi:heme-degrading monooxygenase HmoA
MATPTKEERYKVADALGNAPKCAWTALFITLRNETTENEEYQKVLHRMIELVLQYPGFLGLDVAHAGMKDITVTYWDSLEAIGKWKRNLEHLSAQKHGKDKWFDAYRVVIAEVKKEYGFILPELIPEGGKVPVSSEEAPGPST